MAIQYTSYDLIKKITDNNYSYTNSYVKKFTEADTNVEKLQDKSADFQKKIKVLKRYSPGGTSKAILEKQLTDLVKSYNEMTGSADKVTDKDVQKQLTKLQKLFSDNEKDLKKIGIEKVKGKYEFDSDVFADAADKTINTLLVGHDSLIGKADKIMRKLEDTTDGAQYNTVEQKMTKTTKYETADMALAAYAVLCEQTTSLLKMYDGILSQDTEEPPIKACLENFARSAYHSESRDNENVSRLNQLCRDHESQLARLGLVFDSEYKNMTFDETTNTMSASDFKDAFHELFGENAPFGNTVSGYCKNIFNDIIDPAKIGVSIIDAQI